MSTHAPYPHIMRAAAHAARAAHEAWRVVFTPRPEAVLNLVCFPYAGGTAAVFNSWCARLPIQVELSAVRLPGRGQRGGEPPPADWEALVPPLATALAETTGDRPFAFFGHSLGALLAFEVARWLRRERGLAPEWLFVSGRRAPHVPETEPPTWNRDDAAFVARLRQLNGTPSEILQNPELLAVLVPRLRADFKLVETYNCAPAPPLDCPITAFAGAEDDETMEGRLEAWRPHTRAAFTTHLLPGGHFFLHTHERELLELVRRDLTRCLRAPLRAPTEQDRR